MRTLVEFWVVSVGLMENGHDRRKCARFWRLPEKWDEIGVLWDEMSRFLVVDYARER
jgi:hypothetical protein